MTKYRGVLVKIFIALMAIELLLLPFGYIADYSINEFFTLLIP